MYAGLLNYPVRTGGEGVGAGGFRRSRLEDGLTCRFGVGDQVACGNFYSQPRFAWKEAQPLELVAFIGKWRSVSALFGVILHRYLGGVTHPGSLDGSVATFRRRQMIACAQVC